LRESGSFGDWLLGTNAHHHLSATLENANTTVTHADTNLNTLFENLARSLDNLAGITSNLNTQVQANTNILGSISQAVVDADDLVQGLKRHWLLRSAFRSKTNAPPRSPTTATAHLAQGQVGAVSPLRNRISIRPNPTHRHAGSVDAVSTQQKKTRPPTHRRKKAIITPSAAPKCGSAVWLAGTTVALM
jgi:hypothetical protein